MSLAEELRKLVADAVNIETYLINNRLPWSEVGAIREGLQRTLALAEAQEKQHSAGLREIAEMAIARCAERCKEKARECPQPQFANTGSCHTGDYFACLSIMPDDILREFREKKEKVGK